MDAGAVAKVPSIAAPDEAMATAAVARLELDEAEQAATMDGKLRRARVGDPAAARDRLLRRVVDADNITELLRRDFPSTHEHVLTQHRIEERDILAERDFNQLHPGSIREIRDRLEDRLRGAAPGIGADHANRLAHGAVGRWLLECPLDFPGAS